MSTESLEHNHQVIVVDPDKMIVDLIKYNLENEGYVVAICNNADQALSCDFSNTDLIISEVLLGEINGLMLTSMLKKNPATASIPVILCTTLDSEDDIVKGFEAGADDYVLKPFSLRELMARIKAVLRRRAIARAQSAKPRGASEHSVITMQGLVVDPAARSVVVDGDNIALTRTEMLLLYTFASHPDKFFSHSELYDIVWHKQADGASRALDVSISRLRKKIGPYAANIVNRSGVGYGFVSPQ